MQNSPFLNILARGIETGDKDNKLEKPVECSNSMNEFIGFR